MGLPATAASPIFHQRCGLGPSHSLWMKAIRSPWLVALFGAVLLASCGKHDPTTLGRPPVVESYSPTQRALTAFVGDTLRFSLSASDPDHDRLSSWFSMDGARVSSKSRWVYVVDDSGSTDIQGSVTDGEFTSYIKWTLERKPAINLPPVIEAVLPLESNPTLVVGKSMNFAVTASDPEDDPLSYRFTVNDSVIASTRQFQYVAPSVGLKLVNVRVSDGAHTVTHDWNLKVTVQPDTIPPAMVTITDAETGTDPGEVHLEWTAVGRDGMTGKPSEYLVRTAPDPILTEDDWSRASERDGVPPPLSPGETMVMEVGGIQPARLTYLAVRAVDDFGNISPLGNTPSAVTRGMSISGMVIDANTGAGVPGATVQLATITETTDANGAWQMTELPLIDDFLSARDELDSGIGSYFDMSMPYSVHHLDVVDLYLLPDSLTTSYYTDFLQFFRSMTDIAGNPYGSQERRWQLPIDLYVRPFTHNGLDYQATIERVARKFDTILGRQVFNLVSTLPATGVETTYDSNVTQDYYGVTEWTSDWYPNHGLIAFRTVYSPDTENVLEVTAAHELGHALGLNHSADPTHLMVGGVAPYASWFRGDELRVIRCLYRINRGFDDRWFIRN